MSWYDTLDNGTIEDIKECQGDLDQLLAIVDQLAKDKYDLGFNDGYDVGNVDGWCECMDQYDI